jgi:lysophospholipase L1-like esterase
MASCAKDYVLRLAALTAVLASAIVIASFAGVTIPGGGFLKRHFGAGAQTAAAKKNVTAPLAGYIAARAALARAFPRTGDIVMFGDSLVEQVDWEALLGKTGIVNRGIGGETSATALEHVDTVLSSKPHRVFMVLGMNDFRDGVPVAEVVANYRNMVRAIESVGADVIMQSTPAGAIDDAINGQVFLLNEQLAAMCAEEKHCQYLDLNHVLAPEGRLRANFTWDGLHLTPDGYRAWAQLLAPYLSVPH